MPRVCHIRFGGGFELVYYPAGFVTLISAPPTRFDGIPIFFNEGLKFCPFREDLDDGPMEPPSSSEF